MPYVETIVSVPFDENTYVFWLDGREDCLIVDPGMQPRKIVELVDSHILTPAAVLLTHGHSDHIFGNAAMKKRWPDCPLIIGAGDAYKLTDPVGNLSAGFGMPFTSPPADQTVAEGDRLELAGMTLAVLETPGHSAGHVTFVTEAEGRQHVISGDVLFRGSVGRTDFFDGDFNQLRDAIHTKLFTLRDDALVYPGHGPTTTIAFEREHNPVVGLAAEQSRPSN
ncbi:MAG: MBL fold metallo-hydrolase [Planctomycetota bacterium]